MVTVLPSSSDLLAEAQLAYHRLATGTAVVTARDSNGEQVTYNIASQGNLAAYIQQLKDDIATTSGATNPRMSAPMRVWM